MKKWNREVMVRVVLQCTRPESEYLERIIRDDIVRLKAKVDIREKLWSNIKFAQEVADF